MSWLAWFNLYFRSSTGYRLLAKSYSRRLKRSSVTIQKIDLVIKWMRRLYLMIMVIWNKTLLSNVKGGLQRKEPSEQRTRWFTFTCYTFLYKFYFVNNMQLCIMYWYRDRPTRYSWQVSHAALHHWGIWLPFDLQSEHQLSCLLQLN